MYNKVFKNNQVTYGRPYQIKIPVNLQALAEEAEEELRISLEKEEVESREVILEKAREEAALIIKEAEYEAARIIEEAVAEAGNSKKAIFEEAWQKGYDEGNQSAKEQYEGIICEADSIRDSAREEHDQVLAGMETEIIALVNEVARKVIGNELATSPDTVIHLARQAIDMCSNKNDVVLKVAPEDYEYIEENGDRFKEIIPCSADVAVKQDFSLEPGACIVDTPFGSVDAGVGTRLQKIEEDFREILEGRA